MDSLGFGVIGCGNMGVSLARGTAPLECASVVCVSDVDEGKGRQLASDSKCDFESDYRKMLAREDVDAVLIATPGFLHEEPAIAAAEPAENKTVHWIERPGVIWQLRMTRQGDWLKGPVCGGRVSIRPGGPLINPSGQRGDFGGRQASTVGGHSGSGVATANAAQQCAGCRLAWLQGGSRVAAL